MAKEMTFEVDGVEFRFINHPGGTEEIFHGEELLSSIRSFLGAKHLFNHGGDDYEVKVKAGIAGVSFNVSKNEIKQESGGEKLPALAYLACGWPLALVAVGGAIGGALGGAAFGINLVIYKSQMPVPAKVVLNLLTGLGAVVIWLMAAIAISGR